MITVDAMGDNCPIPVIKTKKAMDALTGPETIEVLVDNEIAVQNVTKMATSAGGKVTSEQKAEKEYVVTVDKPITDDFIKKMSTGVRILDQVTRPCKVTKVKKHVFNIVLTQGLNRQIRRMCGELGYNVQKLKRIRIMNIELGNLPVGQYRNCLLYTSPSPRD